MKKLSILLGLLMMVLFTNCIEEQEAEINLVSPTEMKTLLGQKDVQLVDVRTPDEYKEGHVENAQNIDFNSPTFDDDLNKLDKSKPVILYCQAGGRSAKCAKKLKDAGFIKVYDLEGGFTKWKFKGFKIKS